MSKLIGKAKARARQKERADKLKLFISRRKEINSQIRTFDDPVLKQVCQPVSVGEVGDFVNQLVKVIKTTKNGVGLAAPQIGISKRLFIMRDNPSDNSTIKVIINPEIIENSSETNTDDEEGCLSYPGVFCDVARFNFVKISYRDKEWSQKEEVFHGYGARIVQHEIDHLGWNIGDIPVCHVGDYWRNKK